jgi:transcriptional regulator with XRE-family HTH domain
MSTQTPANRATRRRGTPGRTSLARDASPPACRNVAAVPGFGAELRRLRLDAGLGTRRLAARSGLSRKSVQYFEAGVMRPRRVTVGALGYGLDPDDPARRKRIVAALIAAAGGEDALAADGRWRRYRKRRFELGLLNGSVPWPAEVARRFTALQRADALRRQASNLLDRPGALDDASALDRVTALLDEARRLSDIGGGLISLRIGNRVIRAGFGG